ncbi:hypothetical protein HDU92_009196, partial [Lobulomyces angularis]
MVSITIPPTPSQTSPPSSCSSISQNTSTHYTFFHDLQSPTSHQILHYLNTSLQGNLTVISDLPSPTELQKVCHLIDDDDLKDIQKRLKITKEDLLNIQKGDLALLSKKHLENLIIKPTVICPIKGEIVMNATVEKTIELVEGTNGWMEKQLVITNKKNNKGNNNNTTNNIVITTNSISNSSIEELITQKINSLNFSENDKNGKIKIEIKLEQKDINKILNQSLINNNQLNNVSQPTHSHSINHSSFPNNDHVQKQLDDLHKKTKQINEKQLLLGLKQRELNKLEADQLIEQQNLHNDLERENLEIAKLLKLEQENLNSVLNNQNNCYNYNIEFISTKYLNNFENFKRLQFKTEFLDLNLNLKIKQYDILEFDKNKVENQKLKLEALCREFQNKSILLKDELDNLYKTEKEKRDLLEKNFEISLNELNLIMEKKSNEKKNLDLENETLKNKLSNLTKQYELRELHFQSVLKSKDLELQLQRVRLEKDLSSHKLELRNLLKKFKFAEQTLVKSNDIFTEFQKERNGIN